MTKAKVDNVFVSGNNVIICVSYYEKFGREYTDSNGRLVIADWKHTWISGKVTDLTNKRSRFYKWLHSIEELKKCKTYKEVFTNIVGLTVNLEKVA